MGEAGDGVALSVVDPEDGAAKLLSCRKFLLSLRVPGAPENELPRARLIAIALNELE